MQNHDVDIMHAFTVKPPPLEFVLPGGGISGTVNLLTSPGGTGKSFFALMLSIDICCPEADLLGLNTNKYGRVLYLGLEDPQVVLHGRLHEVGKHLSPSAREVVASSLKMKSLLGAEFDFLSQEWRKYVVDSCDQKTSLIVVDTLSRAHALDENSNGEMSRLVCVLESIAAETNTAILILHHSNKSMAMQGRGDEQQSARGASALVDTARWQGYVAGMTKEEADLYGIDQKDRGFFVRFGVSKQNYGVPFADRWYKRYEGGVLRTVDLIEKKKGGRYV